jgi:hypothetical protein
MRCPICKREDVVIEEEHAPAGQTRLQASPYGGMVSVTVLKKVALHVIPFVGDGSIDDGRYECPMSGKTVF